MPTHARTHARMHILMRFSRAIITARLFSLGDIYSLHCLISHTLDLLCTIYTHTKFAACTRSEAYIIVCFFLIQNTSNFILKATLIRIRDIL